MATSAFKSTTKRTPIGTKSASDDSYSSSTKTHRRSRSLSRFSHNLPESDFRDAPPPRGKFVNTITGSDFSEISLDDLAVEFFPLKSERVDERETYRRRFSRRSSEMSPASNQTLASRRRGRSVSRMNTVASDGKSGVYSSSNRASAAHLTSRRSVSVAPYRISDSERGLYSASAVDRKQDLLAKILLEEQREKKLSKMVKELFPQSNSNTIEQKPLQARKRSNDKNMVSERLTEEAEKCIEDFLSNIEDTDISSIDGETSDASSSLGGMSKQREVKPYRVEKIEGNKCRAGYITRPVEINGVNLPWLQLETINDGSPLPGKSKMELSVTPKTILWDATQDSTSMQDSSGYPNSKHESWSPELGSHSINNRKDGLSNSKEVKSFQQSRFDMDEYLELQRNEKLLLKRWKQRDRISSGCLLLCGICKLRF